MLLDLRCVQPQDYQLWFRESTGNATLYTHTGPEVGVTFSSLQELYYSC